MVVYVLAVAILNLGLGFFAAVHLARRFRSLMAVTAAGVTEMKAAGPRAILQPATADDVARAIQDLLMDEPEDGADEVAGAGYGESEQALDPEPTSSGEEASDPSDDDAEDWAEPSEEPGEDQPAHEDRVVDATDEPAEDFSQATEELNETMEPEPASTPNQQSRDAGEPEVSAVTDEETDCDEAESKDEACDLFLQLHEAQNQRRGSGGRTAAASDQPAQGAGKSPGPPDDPVALGRTKQSGDEMHQGSYEPLDDEEINEPATLGTPSDKWPATA